MPVPGESLWYLNLGLSDVPALPTLREKLQFHTTSHTVLLAANFQVRFCPTKEDRAVMKKTVASAFQQPWKCWEPRPLHQVVTFVVLEKTLGNVNPGDLTCILRLLTLLTFLLTACHSTTLHSPSLTYSECKNTPFGANVHYQWLKT